MTFLWWILGTIIVTAIVIHITTQIHINKAIEEARILRAIQLMEQELYSERLCKPYNEL